MFDHNYPDMENMTQAQCDNCTSLSTEKRYEEDGTTFKDHWVRFYNEHGEYGEFADEVSAGNASDATRKTNAHAHMKANCEMKAAKISTSDAPISL